MDSTVGPLSAHLLFLAAVLIPPAPLGLLGKASASLPPWHLASAGGLLSANWVVGRCPGLAGSHLLVTLFHMSC